MRIVGTIPEAKYYLMRKCMAHGYVQKMQRGSFANGDYRIQLPEASVEIQYPAIDMVPVPPPPYWPPEQTLAKCEEYYYNYILGCKEPTEEEEYTYATRLNLNSQLEKIISILQNTPETNQAFAVIASPTDIDLEHPACLRDLHFKVIEGKLCIYSIWRSNDLYAAFGENMVGLSLLQQTIAESANLELGSLYYFSSGSHLYGNSIKMLRGKI